MKTVKIILSIIATVLGAVGLAAASGMFVAAGLHVSASAVALVSAIGGALAIVGIPFYPFQSPIPEYLRGAGLVLTAVEGWHLSVVVALPAGAPVPLHWFWAVFAFVTVIVGILGKSPIPHADPVPELSVPPAR